MPSTTFNSSRMTLKRSNTKPAFEILGLMSPITNTEYSSLPMIETPTPNYSIF